MRRFLLVFCALWLLILPSGCKQEEVLPPQVFSTSPVFGADDAPLSTTVEITFTTAMDRDSVESAFRIEPSVEGTFLWKGETFVFAPEDLFPGTEYVITFAANPTDSRGNPLGEFSLRFITDTPSATVYEIESFQWLPDGSGLVFSSTRGGQESIWVVDISSREQSLLFEGDKGLISPVVSPDGSLIACVGRASPYLYLYNTNSGGVIKHAAGADVSALARPIFSPDGNTLALLSVYGYADAHSDIFQEVMLFDLKSANPVFASVSPTSETDWLIGFSADSQRLHILSTYDSHNFGRNFRYDHWFIEVPSAQATRVTDDGPFRNFHSGSYSSEVQLFVVSSWSAEELDYSIVETPQELTLYDLNSQRVRTLRVTGQNAFPDTSPSGERIVFASSHADNNAEWDLLDILPSGSDLRQLTFTRNVKRQPRYSPDGTYIAFVQVAGESHSLWVMNAMGGELRRLSQ